MAETSVTVATAFEILVENEEKKAVVDTRALAVDIAAAEGNNRAALAIAAIVVESATVAMVVATASTQFPPVEDTIVVVAAAIVGTADLILVAMANQVATAVGIA